MTSRADSAPGTAAEIGRLLAGVHHDPHSVLGAHPGPEGITVRALRPLAATVAVLLPDGRRYAMEHVHGGVFAAVLPAGAAGAPGQIPDYRLAVAYPAGVTADGAAAVGPEIIGDHAYRHQPTPGEMDLYLIGEGRHEEHAWPDQCADIQRCAAKDAESSALPHGA